MGGGRNPDHIVVRFLVDNREVWRDTGTQSHIMEMRQFDATAYVGKKMRIELVDDAVGSWGHILFDDLCLHNTPPDR